MSESYSTGEKIGIVSFVLVIILVSVGAYQLGQNIAGTNEAGGAEMQPAEVSSTVNGQALYATNCIGCHGAKGEGGVGPALAASAAWSTQEFGEAVIVGKTPNGELAPTMPRFPQLDGEDTSDEQIAALQDYIKSF